jgi:hypothetical protein
VTLDHPAAAFLAGMETPDKEPGARAEQQRSSDGLTVEGLKYSDRVSARAGKTYLVRSVNYNHDDILVAFRTLRRDDDDSIVIAYRILKRYPTPYLDRE